MIVLQQSRTANRRIILNRLSESPDTARRYRTRCCWSALALLALMLGALPARSAGESIAGRVVGIQDGDTLDLLVTATTGTKTQVRVRLAGIDCPEKGQAFGQRARQALADAVFGQDVAVESNKTDRYGRPVGKVLLGGADVNLSLVEDGLCWWYQKYANEQSAMDRQLYESAEAGARLAHRGLWVDPAPLAPWDFRHQPEPAEGYAAACPCDSGRVCTGPRGGHFCVRQSGTKKYLPATP